MGIHQSRTHPYFVDGCFTCRVSTVAVKAISGPVSELDQREARLSKDMDAYKRMRDQGMQPAHLGGAAYVEKQARSRLEVEHPRVIGLSDEARAHAANAVTAVTDLRPGVKPT